MKKFLVLGALSLFCLGEGGEVVAAGLPPPVNLEQLRAEGRRIATSVSLEQLRAYPELCEPWVWEACTAYRVISREWVIEEEQQGLTEHVIPGMGGIIQGTKKLQAGIERAAGTDGGMSPEEAREVLQHFLLQFGYISQRITQKVLEELGVKHIDFPQVGRNCMNLVDAMAKRSRGEDIVISSSDELRAFDRLARVFQGRGWEVFQKPINIFVGEALVKDSAPGTDVGLGVFKRRVDRVRFMNVLMVLNANNPIAKVRK